MRGILFDDFLVTLDPATRAYGGSWWPNQRGDPIVSSGRHVLKLFHGQAQQYDAPVVLDIGANTGSFCLLAAFHPTMRVYAFEPIEAVYTLLCSNIALNQLETRVTPLQLALSDFTGQGEMTIDLDIKKAGLSYLDDRAPIRPSQTETVPVSTLDDWAQQMDVAHIDLIKMDVEGTERRVLEGGEQTIARDWPVILLEATNVNQTVPLLRSWGYSCADHNTDILATRSKS
jgi:FkbM family methyltransferase